MSWLLALVVGVVCGVAGAALSLYAGELIVRAYKISSFEGGSGYFVVFLLMPLGFIVGLVTGVVMMRVSGAHGLGAVALQQGLAVLVTAGVLTIGYAAAYFMAPRDLTVNGQSLTLELELRFRPTAGEEPSAENLTVSLHAAGKDNRFAEVASDHAALRDGWFVTPVEAGLFSLSATRLLSVTREGKGVQVFDLPLRAKPTTADTTWTDWMRSRPPLGASEKLAPDDPAACEIRYRVRFHD